MGTENGIAFLLPFIQADGIELQGHNIHVVAIPGLLTCCQNNTCRQVEYFL